MYLDQQELNLQQLSRGYAWLDTGTHESLIEATEFVQAVEKRTSLKIASVEEIAFKMGWINRQQLQTLVMEMGKSSYANYLTKISQDA